jgi:hypothetical protein
MSFNVPPGLHTNAQKAAEGGYWRDPWGASSSVSLAQAVAGSNTVYTKTRAAFVRRPAENVVNRRVLNRTRISDIVMEKRIKMLGVNSFSYGVTLNYPPAAKLMTTRTSVVKSVSPLAFSRITVLNKAGRWVAVPLTPRRRYLTVVNSQAMALSTPDGSKCIGLSLHDFPKARAGNWFTPLTMYSVRRVPGGISWSVVQQLGKRDATTLGWARAGQQGPRVRRLTVLPGGKFSYSMTWSVGTMAQVQAALLKAAQTKGVQADSNVVDAQQQAPGVTACTVKKYLNQYCKKLRCQNNDPRGACGACMNCAKKACTVKANLNKYCRNLKCKNNDPRGKCGACMNCTMVPGSQADIIGMPGYVPPGMTCRPKKNQNAWCKKLKCKKNDPRGKCGVCLDCTANNQPAAIVGGQRVCTVKKNLNQYCKNLKCQTNDPRGKCGVCMNCTTVQTAGQAAVQVPTGKTVCKPKKNLNQYCKNLKCQKNDKRGKCGVCLECTAVNQTCTPLNIPQCARCVVNDKRPQCEGCTTCV